MIQRDFIMRQLAQMVQVLAAVLGRRREGDIEGAQQALAEGLTGATGLDLAAYRAMSRAEIEALASEDGWASAEKAVGLADLLREDRDPAGRLRARWLYEHAVRVGGPVPFDVADRIAALPPDAG